MLWDEEEQKAKNKIYSFNEYFDESFLKNSKRAKYGVDKKTLFGFIDEDISLHNFPTYGQLVNNINKDNAKNELIDIIKQIDEKDYETIMEYYDQTSVSLKYKNVFIFEYEGVCFINTVSMPLGSSSGGTARGRASGFTVHSNSEIVDCDGSVAVYYPKGKAKLNVKELEFNSLEKPTATTMETKKTVNDVYYELKKKASKKLEKEFKERYYGINHCLRAIRFRKVMIKRVLVPVYFIHCKKPGFDVKYYIDANRKVKI